MTNEVNSVGALLKKYSETSGLWTSVGEVLNISGPSMSRETIDVTSLASSGGYREFIMGFRNPGTIVFTMNFNRADYDALKTEFEKSVGIADYELIIPDTDKTSLEFAAYVMEFPMDMAPAAQITCNVTLQISGPVTVNSGSGS